jgi:hypothetical protein
MTASHVESQNTLSPEVLSSLLKNGLHPQWWGQFRGAEEFAGESSITSALEGLAARLKAIGGIVMGETELVPQDAHEMGRAINELGIEAERFLTAWLAARGAPGVIPRSPAHAAPESDTEITTDDLEGVAGHLKQITAAADQLCSVIQDCHELAEGMDDAGCKHHTMLAMLKGIEQKPNEIIQAAGAAADALGVENYRA